MLALCEKLAEEVLHIGQWMFYQEFMELFVDHVENKCSVESSVSQTFFSIAPFYSRHIVVDPQAW